MGDLFIDVSQSLESELVDRMRNELIPISVNPDNMMKQRIQAATLLGIIGDNRRLEDVVP